MDRLLEDTVLNGDGHSTSIMLTGDFDKQERSFSIMHTSKYFVNKAVKGIHKRPDEVLS